MNKDVSMARSEIQIDTPNILAPNQSPAAFDINKIPVELLQNSVIEELIHQNKDLLARLNVNLRRNGELEVRLKKSIAHKQSLQKQNEQMSDSKLASIEKNQILNTEILKLKKKLEDFYSYYKQQSQINSNENLQFHEQFNLQQNRLNALIRYRKRVKQYIHPLFKKLKFDLKKSTIEKENYENREFELKELIRELSLKVKKQNIKLHEDRTDLKLHLEQRETELQLEIEQLKSSRNLLTKELCKQQKKVQRLEGIQQHISFAENRAITAERERFAAEKTFSTKLLKMQEEVAKLKGEHGLEIQKNNLSNKYNSEIQQEYDQAKISITKLMAETGVLRAEKSQLLKENQELKYRENSTRGLYEENLQRLEKLKFENKKLHEKLKQLTLKDKIPTEAPIKLLTEKCLQYQKQKPVDEIEKLLHDAEKHSILNQ